MRFLLELEKGDTLSSMEEATGVQVALRVLVESLGRDAAQMLSENVEDRETILNLGESLLKKYIETNGSMFIELDEGSVDLVTIEQEQGQEEDNVAYKIAIPSSSRDKFHMVNLNQYGMALSCECEAYIYNPNKKCKHMTRAEDQWAQNYEMAVT